MSREGRGQACLLPESLLSLGLAVGQRGKSGGQEGAASKVRACPWGGAPSGRSSVQWPSAGPQASWSRRPGPGEAGAQGRAQLKLLRPEDLAGLLLTGPSSGVRRGLIQALWTVLPWCWWHSQLSGHRRLPWPRPCPLRALPTAQWEAVSHLDPGAPPLPDNHRVQPPVQLLLASAAEAVWGPGAGRAGGPVWSSHSPGPGAPSRQDRLSGEGTVPSGSHILPLSLPPLEVAGPAGACCPSPAPRSCSPVCPGWPFTRSFPSIWKMRTKLPPGVPKHQRGWWARY